MKTEELDLDHIIRKNLESEALQLNHLTNESLSIINNIMERERVLRDIEHIIIQLSYKGANLLKYHCGDEKWPDKFGVLPKMDDNLGVLYRIFIGMSNRIDELEKDNAEYCKILDEHHNDI